MDGWIQYLIIFGLVVVNAFFAASEISVVTVRKTRMRQLAEDGNGSARAILRLTENTSKFLATIQVGVTLISFFASAFGAVSIEKTVEELFRNAPVSFIRETAPTLALIVVTVLIAFVTLLFGELVPKTLAVERAERTALAVARPIEVLSKVAGPFVVGLTFLASFFVRLLGGKTSNFTPTYSEEEIVSMVETGQAEGVFEQQESDIISRVFEFNDLQVREIMVPRVDVTMLDESITVMLAANEIVASGYSRYPVHASNHREKIIGVAFAKDVLKYLTEEQHSAPIGKLVRPPYFVPESKKVGDLLAELQKSRTQLALVIDEYGGLAGIVTLEDCLEEIVGDIQDEFDAEETRIKIEDDGSYLVDGATSLNELNEALDLNLDDEEIETIGGVVLKRLGRIAAVGDQVTLNEVRQINDPENPNSDRTLTLETVVQIKVEITEGLRIRLLRLKMDRTSEGQRAAGKGEE